MSQETKSKRKLLAVFVWVGIIAILAVAFKAYTSSSKSDAEKELVESTGSSSKCKHTTKVRADSFSGYAILRSDVLKKELRRHNLCLRIDPDKKDGSVDYTGRMKALQNGDADMAVFTVDALLKAGYKLGDFPASMVQVIDVTKGGDAIVAYKSAVPNIEALDDPNARFVMTPDSPSEFLARVTISQFSLLSLPEKWWEEADGAEDAYKKFLSTPKTSKRAFVLWEPYVSKALKDPDVHVLLGTDKVTDYIVDALFVNRKYLDKHPEKVRIIVESYMRAAYSYTTNTDRLVDLVLEDAERSGIKMTRMDARNTVNGIEWKNTVENYGYFGIRDIDGVTPMEDVIDKIAKVLVQTGSIPRNPVEGKAHTLFHDGILKSMEMSDFHPGKRSEIVKGVGPTSDDLKSARTATALPPLEDAQWKNLAVVGNLRIVPLVFGRGNAVLSVDSERELDELAKRIKSWPQYYVKIVGHARAEGDAKANLRLSKQRAEAARDYLVDLGVQEDRLRAEAATVSKKGGAGQSVSFIVGTVPY